ncbi:MAG TPA: glycosyltransferase family 2 protein [Bacteroidia bacterium]|jgi:glycosyltransferase involved in cell wall biosynthesis|nr:glycosyltransferase family 2 protein [Bacteroidia bacterium]
MNLSLVIPLLNEEESLPELAAWIERVCIINNISYEVLFIDDGSRDDSWYVIEQIASRNSSVKGIRLRRNYGKSAALQVGFEAAQGEVVITMDADLQDSPDEIPELFRMIVEERYDLVSGWKQKRYDPLSKTIPTKLFNWATRRMSGIKLHDFNCGLKAYKKDVVKNIDVYGEMHRYIPVLAGWAGFKRIGEKVVVHQKRKYGTTKFGLERFINGFLDLLSIGFVTKFGKRPMHLFGLLGTFLFFIGFIIGVYLAYLKLALGIVKITERPLFFFGLLSMIIGTQLFLTGFISELIVRNSSEKNNYQIEKKVGL